MKTIAWAVGVVGLLACGGFAALLLTTPKIMWNLLPVTAFGAIVAACVAGVAALAATESVSSRRRHEAGQAINERRKAIYDSTIAHMVNAFSNQLKSRDEASIRAMLSMWASVDVVTAYRGYIELINKISEANSNAAISGQQNIPPQLQAPIQLQVGKVAAAMRADVMEREGGRSGATAEQIAKMIFNDYGYDSVP